MNNNLDLDQMPDFSDGKFNISLTDSIMALGGISVSPVPTPGGGGDPYIYRSDGTLFSFVGVPDIPYVLLADRCVEVSFIVEPVEEELDKSYIKEAVVSCDDQQVRVGLSDATIDGQKIAETPESVEVGIFKVWKHTGAGGESRVDVAVQDWQVGVIQDDGTADIHAGDVLEGVPHLGVFVDSCPQVSLTGLLIDGDENSDPEKYESTHVNVVKQQGMRPHHIDESKDLSEVGNGVFIGTFQACDNVGHEFPLVLHIHRRRDGEDTCRRIKEDSGNGLVISWREEEGLDKLSIPLSDILEYAKQPGDLLVHCRQGVCRSALLACACKIARGCDPWQAIADINKGQWRDRGHVAAWNPTTMGELLAWFKV